MKWIMHNIIYTECQWGDTVLILTTQSSAREIWKRIMFASKLNIQSAHSLTLFTNIHFESEHTLSKVNTGVHFGGWIVAILLVNKPLYVWHTLHCCNSTVLMKKMAKRLTRYMCLRKTLLFLYRKHGSAWQNI